MDIILKYFPDLNPKQKQQFESLFDLYVDWNSKINVVSRKDIDQLYVRHVLHSLAIAKFIQFKPGTKILDVGTGGGFPGVPLAIMFPESNFTLVDSIGKKIKVVNGVSQALGLKNCKGIHTNVKQYNQKVDFVVSRAVTNFPDFLNLVKGKIKPKSVNQKPNGIIYLKGGNLNAELAGFEDRIDKVKLTRYFSEEFFEEKVVLHYY